MQRSKQQALMFLLGAVLVGGVLGFSAERVISKKPPRVSARVQMYDDIGIAEASRSKLDSVLDETNCKTGEIMRSIRPSMDSVRADGIRTFLSMLTPAQKSAWEERDKRMKARFDSVEKARDAQWTKEHPGVERPRRCGPSRSGQINNQKPNTLPAAAGAEHHNPTGPIFY
jgi:hypothetical protein